MLFVFLLPFMLVNKDYQNCLQNDQYVSTWDVEDQTIFIMPPPVGKGAISVAFVRPSVAYIANNSRTQMPNVPKFGMRLAYQFQGQKVKGQGHQTH